MKSLIDQFSKKAATAMILLGISGFAGAQSLSDPAWPVSKDVQRVANKKSFEGDAIRASHIRAIMLGPSLMVSKGVNNIGRNGVANVGNVTSNGIPEWTISKGVQKIKYKKRVSEPVPFRKADEITSTANE